MGREQKIRPRSRRRLWPAPVLTGVVATVVIAVMGYTYHSADRMVSHRRPLIDSAMRLRLEITEAHLWFEEILSGDRQESIESVWSHLDEADGYVETMLAGGVIDGRHVEALDDPNMLASISQVKAKLSDFRRITSERSNAGDKAGAGTPIDQQYDAAFHELQQLTLRVEEELRRAIRQEYVISQAVQAGMIVTCILLTAVVGAALTVLLKRQKQSREALAESELKFRSLVETTSDWLWETDADGVYTYVSPQVQEVLGYEPEEIVGKTPYDLMPPEERGRVGGLVGRLWGAREPIVAVENVNIHKDGRRVVLETSGAPILGTDGSLLGYRGIDRDITLRKWAEASLVESEARYRALFDNANDAVFLMDGDRFVDCNSKTLGLFGCTREQIIDQPPHGVFSPEYQPDGRRSEEKAMEKINGALRGEPQEFEWRHTRYDGTPFDAEISLNCVELAGKVMIQALVRDVTQRKMAEEVLRQKEFIIESASIAIATSDLEGNMTYGNPAFVKMWGFDNADEFLGNPLQEYWLAGNRFDAIMDSIDNEGAWFGELRARRKDGTIFDVQVSAAMVFDSKGKPIALTSTSTDITERKIAEAALRESEARYQDLYDNAPDMFVSVDVETTTILRCNQTLAKALGYTKEEITGRPVFDVYHPDCLDDVRRAFDSFVRTGEIRNAELQLRRKDGSKIDVILNVSAVRNEKGKILYSRSSWRDVTERKQMEEKLQESEKRYSSFISHSSEGIYRIDMNPPVPVDLPCEELIERIDKNAVVGEVNEALAKMYGLKPEDIVGRRAITLAPEYGKRAALVLERPNHQVINEETKDIDKDGAPIHLIESFHGEIVDGKLVCIWGVQRNITARKKAEQALGESEHRYRHLFETMTSGVAVYEAVDEGTDFIVKDFNSAAERMEEVKREEIIGRRVTEVFPGVEEFGLLDVFRRVCETGQSEHHPVSHYKDNRIAGWRDNYVYKAPSGEVVAVYDDVTNRKQAEESLRESQAKLASIFRVAPTGIGVVANRVILEVNDRICEMVGYARDEIVDKNARILYPSDEDYEYVGKEKYRQISDRGTGTVETRWMHKDGRVLDILMSSTPLDPSDLAAGVTFTALDITNRKRAETERARLIDILETTSDLVSSSTPDGELTYLNRAGKRMLGWPEDESCGGCDIPDIHPDWAFEIIKTEGIPTAIEHGVWEGETALLGPNGMEIPVSQVIMAHKSQAGEVEYLSTIMRDITDRKKSEEQIERIFNMTGYMVCVASIDGYFKRINSTFEQTLGYSSEELLSRPYFDFVHPDDRDRTVAVAKEKLAAGIQVIAFENRYVCKDGTCKWLSWTSRPVTEEGVTYAIAYDITERKKAEEELASTRSLLAAAVEQTPAGVLIADAPDVRIRMVNSAGLGIRGETPEALTDIPAELHPQNWQTFHPDGTLYEPQDLPLSRAILKGEIVMNEEVIIRRSSGEDRWALANAAPVRNKSGDITAGVVVFPDITERKHAEEAMRQTADRRQREADTITAIASSRSLAEGHIGELAVELTEAASSAIEVERVGVWLFEDGETRLVNIDNFVASTGEHSSGAVLLGQEFSNEFAALRSARYVDADDPLTDPRTAGYVEDYLKPNRITAMLDGAIRYEGRSLGVICLEHVDKVHHWEEDEIAFVCQLGDQMALALSNRQRKVAEQEVKRLNEQLEERVRQRTAQLKAVNKELEAFAYSVSHDLRAPLRSMDGFSKAVMEDCGDKLGDQGKDYLNRVRAASQRMGQLIDDILTLSRLTRSEMKYETVDLSAIARSISRALADGAPDRKVEWVIAENAQVEGDAVLLGVLMENLLGNAWKFTEKHETARIEFGLEERDGTLVYCIRDDGAGFDMAYSDKLFGAFQRLHSVTEFDGTGIGLATVQRIIGRHGGRIWAEAEVEKGATFYFTLDT